MLRWTAAAFLGTLALLLVDPADAQGNAKYVAAGTQGSACVVGYSYDGATWLPATLSGATAPCWGVGFNGTHWVAAQAGRVWVSTDGANWQDYATPMTTTTWGGVTWGDGRWIVAGGTSQVTTSTDGTTWTMVPFPPGVGNILGTSFNGTTWMNSGNNAIAVSPDGLSWTVVGNGGLGGTPNARAQIFLDGRWWVGSQTPGGTAWTADNGATWTLGAPVAVTKFAHDSLGTIVGVGATGLTYSSTDGMATWTTGPNLGAGLYGLTYSECQFVAVGYSGRVATSPDGVSWTLHSWPHGATSNVLAVATSGRPGCGPKAVADSYVFNEDQPARTFNVVANDLVGSSGLPFVVDSWTAPSHGTLIGAADGNFTYQPYPDRNGADSFTYTIRDQEGLAATATVTLTIQAVNDPPSFVGGEAYLMRTPSDGPQAIPGWASGVRTGPPTAVDEQTEEATFVLTLNTKPSLFSGAPTLQRSGSAESTVPVAPPTGGAFGLLSFAPSGSSGRSQICFRIVDSGGTGAVVNSWGETAVGNNTGPESCLVVEQNAPPVAYYEAKAGHARVGEPLAFDSCPGPVPRCTFDPDDAVAALLWEFGDGASAAGPVAMHAFQVPGVHRVRLSAWDERGSRGTFERDLHISVGEEVVPEEPPSAVTMGALRATEDRTVLEGTVVALWASLSNGDDETTYHWRQVAGPRVTMEGSSFTAPTVASAVVLQFEVRAIHAGQESEAKHVAVRVVSANQPPVAVARAPREVMTLEEVVLDGSESYDDDGNLVLEWEQEAAEGSRLVILRRDGAKASFVAPPHPGPLQFLLKASDGRLTSQDTVTILVVPRPVPSNEAASERDEPIVAPPPPAAIRSSRLDELAGAGALLAAAVVAALVIVRRRMHG